MLTRCVGAVRGGGCRHRWLDRVLVVDLDVHQGNGNAVLFHEEERVFTFSLNCRENLFSAEERSDADFWLDAGAGDAEYMAVLEAELPTIFEAVRPQLVFFQVGWTLRSPPSDSHPATSHGGLLQPAFY